MRRDREIPFAFDVNDFRRALSDVEESKKNKKGTVIDISEGTAGGSPVGLIKIEEDV